MSVHQPLVLGELSVRVIVTRPPWYENSYVLRHAASGEQVVVDPGGDAEDIAAVIDAAGGKLVGILLTHGHPDHIGGVAALERRFGVASHAHRDEQAMIAQAASFASALMGAPLEPPGDCRWFVDGPALTLGGQPIRAVHTPGHTPGGVCYVFPGFALTGDTLFNQGVGRTDLPGGDGRKLGESITALLAGLTDDAVLFSGHGPAWTAGEARQWWKWMM